jgi:hypothetical protein
MMKHLNAFGVAAWNVTLVLLKGFGTFLGFAALIVFCGSIAYGVYVAVQWLGFGDQEAYWSALVSIGVMGVFYYTRDTPALREKFSTWALTLMAWVLIVVIILAIGFAVLTVIISPPTLYSLVVVGVILLAGILWQLTKLTSKQ